MQGRSRSGGRGAGRTITRHGLRPHRKTRRPPRLSGPASPAGRGGTHSASRSGLVLYLTGRGSSARSVKYQWIRRRRAFFRPTPVEFFSSIAQRRAFVYLFLSAGTRGGEKSGENPAFSPPFSLHAGEKPAILSELKMGRKTHPGAEGAIPRRDGPPPKSDMIRPETGSGLSGPK